MKSNINSKIAIVVIILIMLTLFAAYKKRSAITWINELLPITGINTDKKVVAIACNVYEGRDSLDKILETLHRTNTKISFFIGGIWAERNPDMIIKLKNREQDIQNHGYLHKDPSKLSYQKNIKEIKDTENLVFKIANIKTNLFEPPSGDYDENTLKIANTLGYKVITWSIDTIDWREDATEELILNRIEKKLHPGAIILIHPKPVTADTITKIIGLLRDKGYEIKTVSELINE